MRKHWPLSLEGGVKRMRWRMHVPYRGQRAATSIKTTNSRTSVHIRVPTRCDTLSGVRAARSGKRAHGHANAILGHPGHDQRSAGRGARSAVQWAYVRARRPAPHRAPTDRVGAACARLWRDHVLSSHERRRRARRRVLRLRQAHRAQETGVPAIPSATTAMCCTPSSSARNAARPKCGCTKPISTRRKCFSRAIAATADRAVIRRGL